jgi:hypothetical protein
MDMSALTDIGDDDLSEIRALLFALAGRHTSPHVIAWLNDVRHALEAEQGGRHWDREPPEDDPLETIHLSEDTSDDDREWLTIEVQRRRDDLDYSDTVREFWNECLGRLADDRRRARP